MSVYYVYAHIRRDTGRPFYIGKGSRNRAFSKSRRNPYWFNIVNKHGYEVIFLAKDLTEEQAFEREKLSIRANKLFGEKLVNMTDGGEGVSGYIPPEEVRKKMSDAQKGRKMSDENRNRLIAANKGRKLSEEHKKKLRTNHRGNTGKRFSEETKRRMSKSSAKARQVIDLSNGYVWDSCKEAACVYGMKHTTLSNQLNGRRKNKTNLRYV